MCKIKISTFEKKCGIVLFIDMTIWEVFTVAKFTEENIRKIFGPEAAEDEAIERLKEYYFKSDVYDHIHNDLPLRILVGHKGIGKSATFKISFEENRMKKRVVVWIRPDDIMELCNDSNNLLKMIRDWKAGLSEIIYKKVLENLNWCIYATIQPPVLPGAKKASAKTKWASLMQARKVIERN